MGSEAQVSLPVFLSPAPDIITGFRKHIYLSGWTDFFLTTTELNVYCLLGDELIWYWFQMGWAEDLPEPAEAVSVLRHQQRNQGFRQVLQEPALLLDSWSWSLCKSCDISHSPRICFPSHVRVLNRDAPEWSWPTCFLMWSVISFLWLQVPADQPCIALSMIGSITQSPAS